MEHSEAASYPSAEPESNDYVVAQATGVLVAQFALSPDAAFEKLAAEADSLGRPVIDVAHEIVETRGL